MGLGGGERSLLAECGLLMFWLHGEEPQVRCGFTSLTARGPLNLAVVVPCPRAGIRGWRGSSTPAVSDL